MTTLQQYEQALRSHDWYYDYSDDHRYYTKGRDEWAAISRMRKELKEAGLDAEAQALYDQIQPFGKR